MLIGVFIGLAGVAASIVVAYFAATRRGRNPVPWVVTSLLFVPLLVLLQLRHRSRPSVAPGRLGWISRLSYIVIFYAAYAIFFDRSYFLTPAFLESRLRLTAHELQLVMTEFFATVFIDADIYRDGPQFEVNGVLVAIGDAMIYRAAGTYLLPTLLLAVLILRWQPLSALLTIVWAVVVCTLADVATGVLCLSFYSRSDFEFLMPTTPSVLAGLAIFWGAAIIACWLFPDYDPDDPDVDLTTAPAPPPLPALDTAADAARSDPL